MKQRYAFLFALAMTLFLAACSSDNHDHEAHQAKKDAHKIAHITWRDIFQQDTIHLGDTIHMPFVFFNTGWKPVNLVECAAQNAACECIVPTDTVPMGGQDTVYAHCVPQDTGNFVAFYTVTHNSPKQPDFALSLKVQVLPAEE